MKTNAAEPSHSKSKCTLKIDLETNGRNLLMFRKGMKDSTLDLEGLGGWGPGESPYLGHINNRHVISRI